MGIKHGKMVERKQIIKLYAECKKDSNIYEIEKLNGILCSLRQIKLDIFSEIYSYVQHYEQELRNLSKKRFYKYQRRLRYIMWIEIRSMVLANYRKEGK